MSETVLILSMALVLRFSGASIRVGNYWLPVRAFGWVLCTTSAWIAVGGAGAWFPIWPALAIGVIGALINFRLYRWELWIGFEMIVVGVSGFFSIPAIELRLLAVTVLAVGGAGFAVDSLLVRSSRRVRTATFVLPYAVCFVIGVVRAETMKTGAEKLWDSLSQSSLFHIGLTSAHKGERVLLETGAVAWLERPSGNGPSPGALLFHGAHRDGSMQRSAIVLRRALRQAGFIVLSVDHPGYGESPVPNLNADVDGWDPLPTALAAFRTLCSIRNVDKIFAVGHSMGTIDPMRLLSAGAKLNGVVLFGAALPDPGEHDEYWYGRFHTDRRLSGHPLSQIKVIQIRHHFYDSGRIVQNIHPAHAPILFVRFGREWPNLVATRDLLYNVIPEPKMTWDLSNSTHYFNTSGGYGLIIGDTRITQLLVARFHLLASERLDAGN